MSQPGVKISSRLAQLAVAFIIIVIAGTLLWPRMHMAKPEVPVVPVTQFAPPPKPIAPPAITSPVAKLLPIPLQPTPAATPQAKPTPCQPCIEAANEVLARYLHAIRTGAGTDDHEDRNVFEAPKVFSNPSHPVWVPAVPSHD